MYYEFGRHQLPHFHARFGEYKASFLITPPAMLSGAMPRKQQRLILAWAELHGAELLENWQRIEQEQPIYKIDGLS